MMNRSCELLQIASESSNNEIKESAFQILTSIYMIQEDYDNALKSAKKLNPKANDTILLLATIHKNKGENDIAKKLYQQLLLNNIQTSELVLQSLSRLSQKESNVDEAEFFLETIIKLNTLFEVQNNGEPCELELAELYARNDKKDNAIKMLKRYINYIKDIINNSHELISSSKFFTELSFSSNRDETSQFIKEHIVYAIVNTSAFDKIKEDEEFKDVIEELKNI